MIKFVVRKGFAVLLPIGTSLTPGGYSWKKKKKRKGRYINMMHVDKYTEESPYNAFGWQDLDLGY